MYCVLVPTQPPLFLLAPIIISSDTHGSSISFDDLASTSFTPATTTSDISINGVYNIKFPNFKMSKETTLKNQTIFGSFSNILELESSNFSSNEVFVVFIDAFKSIVFLSINSCNDTSTLNQIVIFFGTI